MAWRKKLDDLFNVYTGSPANTVAGGPNSFTGVPTTPAVGAANAWEDVAGAVGSIDSGQLLMTDTTGGTGAAITNDLIRTDITGDPDQRVDLTVSPAGTYIFPGIVLRRVDANNKYLIHGDHIDGSIKVSKVVAGVETVLNTYGGSANFSDAFVLSASAQGVNPTTLTISWLDAATGTTGTFPQSFTDSSAPLQASGLGYGLNYYSVHGVPQSAHFSRVQAYDLDPNGLAVSPATIHSGSTGVVLTVTRQTPGFVAGTPGSPVLTVDSGTITAQTTPDASTIKLTYNAPLSAGTITITDPSTGLTATASVIAPTLQLKPGAYGITPDRANLLIEMETVGGASTRINSVADGGTVTINGAVYPLTGGVFRSDYGYAAWALGLRDIQWMDDSAAALGGAGATWSTLTLASQHGVHSWYGDALSSSTDATATATYTFAPLAGTAVPLVPWKYNVYTIRPFDDATIAGAPGNTTDARWTITDGTTTISKDIDQTTFVLQSGKSHDRVIDGYHLMLLGSITTSASTLTVTLANAGVAGTRLLADAVVIERDFSPEGGHPIVPDAATVTLNLPDGTIGTISNGTSTQITGLAIPLLTDAEFLPVNDTGPWPEIAYGLGGVQPGYPARVLANLLAQGSGWAGGVSISGPNILASIHAGGTAWIEFGGGARNGFDERGLLTMRPGTYRFVYYAPGSNLTPSLSSQNSPAFTYPSGPTFVANTGPHSTHNPATGHYDWLIEIAFPAEGFGVQDSYSVVLNLHNNDTADYTFASPMDLRIYGPEIAEDFSLAQMVHPKAIERLKGTGVKALRALDFMNIVDCEVVDFADWDATKVISNVPGRIFSVNVVRFDPVDLTSADADKALEFFGGSEFYGRAVIKCTVDDTSPIARGAATAGASVSGTNGGGINWSEDRIFFPSGGAPPWASSDGGTLNPQGGDVPRHCIVTGPTTMLMIVAAGGGTPPPNGLVTLAAPQVVTGCTMQFWINIGNTYQTFIQICKETGTSPHVQVPTTATKDCAYQMGFYAGGQLANGTPCDIEVGNEIWNFFSRPYWRFAAQAHHLGMNSPFEYLALLSSEQTKQFAAGYAAAGNTGKVNFLLGAWMGVTTPTISALNWLYAHRNDTPPPLKPDKLIPSVYYDSYLDFNAPPPVPSSAITAFYDKQDASGLVTTQGIYLKYGAIPPSMVLQRAAIESSSYGTPSYFTGMPISSYEGGSGHWNPNGDGARGIEASLHHRAFPVTKYAIQMMALSGVVRFTRYTYDSYAQLTAGVTWIDFPYWGMGLGTGAATENPIYSDQANVLSQQGGAMLAVAGLTLVPTTLQDGGFESPVLGTGNRLLMPANGTTPWTFTAGVGGDSSGIVANGQGGLNGIVSPEGVQVGQLGDTDTISQDINWASGNYTISFRALQRVPSQTSQQDFNVVVGGTVIDHVTPPSNSAFTLHTTPNFSVTSGIHTLAFVGLNTAGGGENWAFLDDIRINPIGGSPIYLFLRRGRRARFLSGPIT